MKHKDEISPPEELLRKCETLFPYVMDRAWKLLITPPDASGYVCRCSKEAILFKLVAIVRETKNELIKETYKVGQCSQCQCFRFNLYL